MKKYIKIYADIFLSDTLLLATMLFMLFLFGCMWFVPDHIVALQEGNLAILTVETIVCIFAVVWSSRRVRRNLRTRGRHEA